MKQYSKKLFSLLVLLSATSIILADCCDNDCDNDNDNHVVPFIQFRSQGRNMARKLEGTTSYAVYQDDMDGTYGTFNMTLEYDQSFRNKNIACCLFGNSIVNTPVANSCDNDCDSSTLIISGLGQNGLGTGRAATDWMAENFLLPRDFKSAISFSPKMRSVILDFNLFVGLDRWCNGLYFRLYGPVVWNKANLRAQETLINAGTATTFDTATPPAITAINGGYPQGFFDITTGVPTQSLFNSALQFFGGCQFPRAPYTGSAVTVQPLRFAKFSNCNLNAPVTTVTSNNCNRDCDNDCDDSCGTSNHKTGFAELRGEFGWNYFRERSRFLINIQAAAPTGTRPNAEFLFPAYVGNGKHWELGGGIGGSWMMWGSEDGEKAFSFIVEADITHLFKSRQKMTFDLKGKPNSRYMLAERLGTPAADAALTTDTATFAAPNVTAGEYAPVANFSTRNVKVGFGVQGDVVAMFNYTCRGFSWDLGYNFWGMSCSKISCPDDCDNDCDDDCNPIITPFPANTWALKGDASVVGCNSAAGLVFGLGATESQATIFTGTNAPVAVAAGTTVPTNNPLSNPGIDTPTPAIGVVPGGANVPLFVCSSAIADSVVINTSTTPLFISLSDLDIDGARQRGISNKVFTHFNYTWLDCCDRWTPYVGFGFSAEFGSSGCHDDCPTTTTTTTTNNNNDCSSCRNCALSQWGVEIKGGVSFH